MKTRGITLVAHTHWDREWYEPFEVFRAHLVEMLDDALPDLERDPRLHFTLDGHVALVDDYLELRPENEARLRALVAAGRLHVGPWYTQADTLLTDGEGLIRNLAFGIRRAEELGGAMRVGYMPDQFGHAAQVPQLLRLFGIDGAVLWRGVGPERPPHAFRWQSPDGSAVTALWLQDGYGSGRRIPSDPAGFVAAVGRMLERLGSWLADMPVLIPIGDDHVRLATWLPEAAAALASGPHAVDVKIGGYQHHLPQLGPISHTISGELRSPVFAPVLAGVASARIREKQASHRATQLLLRYAEPLSAWVALLGGEPPTHLLRRAWKQLFLNQAHDSAAGCGADAAHEDVQARYRWAEQLAAAARDQALAALRVDTGALPHVLAFTPVASERTFVVEAEIPKSIEGPVVSVGPDGIARPVQSLSAVDEPPVFEGEFSASELGVHLGGLDPATPIFGKYLTGITARDEGNGTVRLDVGLGETPPPPNKLVDDQARITRLLQTTVRFKIVLHAATPTRRVVLQAGPGAEAALTPIALRAGVPDEKFRPARRIEGVTAGIASGSVSVVAQEDGTVIIRDTELPLAAVRANQLVDDGDRGDLYHCDPVGEAIRAGEAKLSVVEAGPIRARLRIEQTLVLPRSLASDRRTRGVETRPMKVLTDVTLTAGERRVEFATLLVNEHEDHRLRALVRLPLRAERLDVEHGLSVVTRSFDPSSALGAGSERAAPTGQHHQFVDATDGSAGVALFSRGLPEHEATRTDRETELALTLLRSVGWLSRGDLSVIDHAAGPMLPTPNAQELGAHRFEYALVLHAGDWRRGDVLSEARRYLAPPQAVAAKGQLAVPTGAPSVEVSPKAAILTALYPATSGGGVVARLLNTAASDTEVTLRASLPVREAAIVNPLEERVDEPRATVDGGVVRLTLRPWQLASVLFR